VLLVYTGKVTVKTELLIQKLLIQGRIYTGGFSV